jgi:hypothetical protein
MEILTEKQTTPPPSPGILAPPTSYSSACTFCTSRNISASARHIAASVRARIPAAERKLLEEVYPITGVPLKWLATLPAPKDAISALWALKQIPPAERMLKL